MNDRVNEKEMDSKVGKTGSLDKESKSERKHGKHGKKGKKGRSKGGSRDLNRGKMFNDLSWYTRNPKITEAFAKIPFNYIVGNRPTGFIGTGRNLLFPALSSFGIDWVTSPYDVASGTATTHQDILNEVATIVYNIIRRHNSGATNGIEYVDVINSNLIAGIDILANLTYMQRHFKIANSFSWRNRMIPRYIFNLLSLDFDDFIANQANYRGRLNTLVAEARTIKVLNNYPFINAILAEYMNVFKDSDTDTGREQLLISYKPVYHIYDPAGTAAHPGGCVRLMTVDDLPIAAYQTTPPAGSIITNFPKTKNSPSVLTTSNSNYTHKFSYELDILTAQIHALINDSDFNLIQADIEKAFGEQGTYLVADAITSDEVIQPVYSGEFWTMVHNGTFLPVRYDTVSVNAVPRDGGAAAIMSKNQMVNTVYQYHDQSTGEVKLNTHWHYCPSLTDNPATQYGTLQGTCDSDKDDPTPEDIIAMTRYKGVYTGFNISSAEADFKPETSGATYGLSRQVTSNFICFGGQTIHMYMPNNNTSGNLIILYSYWENNSILTTYPTVGVGAIPLLGFEHRPILYVQVVQAGTTSTEVTTLYNDIGNIRCLTVDELSNLNEACFMSLWSLPELATI